MLSEKRSDLGCEGRSTKIKPGYKTENISQHVCAHMVTTNQKREEDAFPCSASCFLSNVSPRILYFAESKQHILGVVNLEVSKITPNSKDAFMRRTFVVSSSVCRVLFLHALVFRGHAYY